MNARQQLEAAANWLGWQDEELSAGLKTPEDGLKLWAHWQKNTDLPEFADGGGLSEEEYKQVVDASIEAIGYYPLADEEG